MSDTTETVSLRDALTEMLYDTARRKKPIGYVVDDILEALRAHRTDVLEALQGEVVGMIERSDHEAFGYRVYRQPPETLPPDNAPVWVFREASE